MLNSLAFMEPPSSGSRKAPGEHRFQAAFFTVVSHVVIQDFAVSDTLRPLARVGSMCLAIDCGAAQERAPQ